MAPLFDLQNKKDRLKQRFDAFRKDLKSDPAKKISDVLTKNSSVIDLSRVKSRSAEATPRVGKTTADAPAAALKGNRVPERPAKKIAVAQTGIAQEAPYQPLKQTKKPMILFFAAGAVFALAFVLLSFAFDRATITVTPKNEHLVLNGVSIGVDSSLHEIDIAAKQLPGLRIEVSQSAQKSFPTSGKKYVESRAAGVITVANGYSSRPQQLVAGTRFVEQGGKVFRLARGIAVPGAIVRNGVTAPSSVDVPVIADAPGSAYNIASANFKIPGFAGTPKYEKFSAVSKNSFSGGFVGETRFATESDIRNASEQVTKEAYDAIKTELAGKIPSGFSALDGSRSIQITEVTKPLGLLIGDSFDFSASGTGFVILFRQSDFAKLLEAIVLPREKDAAFRSDASRLEFSKTTLRRGGAGFDAVIDGDALFQDRIATAAIQNGIAGLSQESAGEWLRTRQDIQSFELKIFPSWNRSLPSAASSVKVEVRQ